MGDGESSKNIARTTDMENLSLDISSNISPRDLLQRFMGGAAAVKEEDDAGDGDDGEIELNLGLSLGGRFGVDRSTKLARSSSIASCLPVVRDDSDVAAVAPPSAAAEHGGLVRSSSLPVETEEEWRKRKELQTMRRMEAKRRRSEKQRNSKSGELSLEEKKEIEMNLRGKLEKEKSSLSSLSSVKRLGSWVGSQSGSNTWAGANKGIIRSGIDGAMGKGKGGYGGKMQGGIRQQASIGSIESKGGSSSSVSDLESKTLQGSSGEVSPASIQSMQESANLDTRSSTTKPTEKNTGKTAAGPDNSENVPKKPEASRTRGKEIGTNSLEDMPCVFTKGDGPNGRRVEGILYRYGKGEEVRIMCVCHGSFHSPAEFVRHAGGTDVDNPLKHIVVNPNSSSSLM